MIQKYKYQLITTYSSITFVHIAAKNIHLSKKNGVTSFFV